MRTIEEAAKEMLDTYCRRYTDQNGAVIVSRHYSSATEFLRAYALGIVERFKTDIFESPATAFMQHENRMMLLKIIAAIREEIEQ